MCDRNLKHQRLRNFAARNQGLIIHPFSTLPVAKRTRAHILEQARHIPLPHSESSSSDEEGEYIFEMGDQTLKQLAAPTFDPNLLSIVDDEAEIEIKPGLIRALPTFSGFRNTNSLGSVHMNEASRFLKEFHIACAGMKPAGVTLDQLKLKAFPLALSDAAKEWLFEVPAGTITTWDQMLKVFAERYFPASLIANIRKEICGIRQDDAETLHEYWERFKKLCDSCPNHQISEQLLIQYFYEGLRETDRNLVDAASGGALVDKTPAEAKKLIANMAANSQYRGGRNITSTSIRQVNEVVSSNLEQQVAKLTSLVERVMIEKGQEKVCGLCSMVGHPTDMCPTLQEEEVNSIGGGQGQQRRYDPFSQTYNPGWRDHPNLRYGNAQQQAGNSNLRPPAFQQQQASNPPPGFHQQPQYQPRPQNQQVSQSQSGSMSLEDIVKVMADNTLHFQQETRSGLKNLENQVSQLANTVGKLQAQNSNKLPSQPERNPKENASAISLRSGKQLEVPAKKTERLAAHQEEQETIVPEQDKQPTKVKDVVSPNTDQFNSSVPFPSRLSSKNKKREQEKEKETLDIFRKVEVNIPLLEAIRQVPRYAKFLKELCTNKRRLSGDEKVSVSENVSAVLQRKVPPKCKDPGIFTIPCKIGNTRYDKCMLDLGASINVMPLYIYKALNLGPLKDTRVIIQLADRSNTYPVGVVEDVLVQVNELVFPADFYVLDMPNDESPSAAPILLGRPFLKTSRTKIDVHSGVLTMEFDGEVIRFNLFDAMRYPSDCESVSSIDVIDALTEQVFFLSGHDGLDVVLTAPMEKEKYTDLQEHFELKGEVKEAFSSLEILPDKQLRYDKRFMQLPVTSNRLLPSIVQAPEVELKPLPDHLKYAFLGENDTLPVIIASNLTPNQEQKLVQVLKEHKTALGWTVADIKGISPSMCQHRILLEEGAKPVRQVQRRLNPPMMEVVKKEVMKLLKVGVIYPISDSPWVSPLQVVPKKSGVTVVENNKGEMVPTRVQNGWRVCVDYRKLNSLTRKDHFPLPFIDQMVERLAGHAYYCFLDGFSGYVQVPITPEDQEKTTFTCPYGTFAYRRMPFGLCNAPETFQRCMVSIFSDYLENFIEVFMDDFTVHGDSFDRCLEHLTLVLKRCLETNLVLNSEKCHFMVQQGIVLGHIVSSEGIKVDKAKIDLISSLPYPTSVREVRSFLGHAGFYRRFIEGFSKIAQPLCKLLQKDLEFHFDEACKQAERQVGHCPCSTTS
ncbi:uncharacterized protein LOC110700074 isoform X1 [Chenopodium quinoa]|uniref:uncharacterized protein LOC110700074 isoform X1 n=2 Tax=Chenopodium quinoa TaxID=63459 RepID=UPI000B78ACC3|nr:uncharacterized protein LOC110700074 isoform X1 [Chenopodium quinoa]